MTQPKRGRPPGTPQPPGTGRKPKPPGQKYRRINITVSPALYDRLTQAQGDGQTRTAVITAILDDQLPEYINQVLNAALTDESEQVNEREER